MNRAVGLDFGTTNSAIAVVSADGRTVDLADYPSGQELTNTFRSIIYFFHPSDTHETVRQAVAGPEAIQVYLEADPRGRLLQSIKSFLASRLFTETKIHRTNYTLEDLIAIIIRDIKTYAEKQFGNLGGTVVAGRPVRFSGASSDQDDDFAVERLRNAIRRAGFDNVVLEYEPVAAAFKYEERLDHDELVLIADFGGGTSDFSLLELGPSAAGRSGSRRIIGTDGVAIAGNDFDSCLVRYLVAPELGLGSEYSSMGKLLPVPSWLFKEFERWHYLSFLRTKKTIEMLERIRTEALEPEKIDSLITVIEDDLGFHLYRAIEKTKLALSRNESATFEFDYSSVAIRKNIRRSQFERLIRGYLMEIENCVDRLLTSCGVAAADVDSVFMTGGSSFVPAVVNLFSSRFGASKLRGGNELTSVSEGLALKARSMLAEGLIS